MANNGSPWSWDPNRQDWYYVTQDYTGQYTYHYRNGQQQHQQQQQQPTLYDTSLTAAGVPQFSSSYSGYQQPPATYAGYETTSTQPNFALGSPPSGHVQRPRVDSTISNVADPAMPPPAPSDVRAQVPHMILGTPEAGWYERLDSSYRMRTGAEIYQFFKIGKVFSMLHTQAASANALPVGDNISVVQYGEHAFSQIRRFVVVEVRRGFVYACPITTYSGRGCLKTGCIASEHSVVYLRGTDPNHCYIQGEYELGLTKRAICIVPANSDVSIQAASRLHYQKAYPIEMNVKVKDIGDVAPEDLGDLIRYYKDENGLI